MNKEKMQREETGLVPLRVSQMDFDGDPLMVVLVEMDRERQVLVAIRQFCEHLGLDWPSQYQRIRRDEELVEEIASVTLTPALAPQQNYKRRYAVACLPLEMLPGFLFGLTPSKVREEYRQKVRTYRRRCYRAFWRAFLRGKLFPEEETRAMVMMPEALPDRSIPISYLTEQVASLTEQIETLMAIVAFLREHRA